MKIIENCYRQYYYTYYGSHNGWLKDSSVESKIAWRLKKLTNIWLMFGDKLHKVISDNLKRHNKNINDKELIECMRNTLNYGVKQSAIKQRTGEWDEYPKGEMLQEYYYGHKLDEDVVLEIKERINKCCTNFCNCETYIDLKKENTKLIEADEGVFDYFTINNVKVFALIDTLYIDEDGNYVIVDWKTGRYSEYDKDQLIVYAIYVMEKYGVKLERIKGRIEYLLIGEKYEYSFSEDDINNMKVRIDSDLKVIDNFLVDFDYNIPREKEVFRKCNDDKKCLKCKFKKLCFDLEGLI